MIEEFEEADSHFLVCEFCDQGTLERQIESKDWDTDTNRCLKIIYEIGIGVFFLHKHGVAHRDLKPDNILVHQGAYKISDFGFANDEEKMESLCGTPLYIAPEILPVTGKKYNKKVDVWSLGVILYYMLTKEYPFYSEKRMTLYQIILQNSFRIKKEYRKKWSPSLRSLFQQCFEKDPKKRLSIDEFLNHEVFRKIKPLFGKNLDSINLDITKNGINYKASYSQNWRKN